jgi:iron(III) transport system permease protein
MGASVSLASTASHALRIPLFRGRGLLLVAMIYAGLAIGVVYPLLAVFVQAFSEGAGLSVARIGEVFTTPDIVRAVVNTLIVSVLTVVLAAGIGVTLAWLIARSNIPLKRLLDPLNMIPFYLSSVVGALSWQVIAAPRTGLINSLLAPLFSAPPFNIYSVGGIALVLGLFYAPYVYLFTLGSLQSMDASLEDAARMSGASKFKTAVRITLPLSAPAILSACILVFVTAAGIFGVPLVLGVPGSVHTLSTLIYRSINEYPPDFATAAILSSALFLFTAVFTAVQILLLRGRRFTTVTGKGYRPRMVDLGRWRWPAVAVNGLYLVFVIGPFVALLMVSLQDAWTGAFDWARLTLANYHKVVFVDVTAKRGLLNSLVISTVGATIAVGVCLALALVIHRTRLPGRTGIAPLAMVPVTVPGIVFGLGLLVALVATPLYGTLWIIMIAYIVHYLPTGLRNSESLVQSVSRELDESARMSGATWRRAMTLIVIPLVAPGIVSLWLLLFVTYIREVSSSMMLFTYGTETMSIALIRIMEYEPYGVSGAFGVLQTLLVLACVAAIRQVASAQQG